jgi:hypothetical protein
MGPSGRTRPRGRGRKAARRSIRPEGAVATRSRSPTPLARDRDRRASEENLLTLNGTVGHRDAGRPSGTSRCPPVPLKVRKLLGREAAAACLRSAFGRRLAHRGLRSLRRHTRGPIEHPRFVRDGQVEP